MDFKEQLAADFVAIQDSICKGLEQEDGKAVFKKDAWDRPGGGGGESRVLMHGNVFEKGGVNFSKVHGALPEAIKKEFKTDASEFFATGVSIVIHPNNPWVPIVHMNIRYFELPDTGKYWFGGGIDLTPHYVVPSEAQQFHQTLKATCDQYHSDFYPKFKAWADDYFFIQHRNETRGVGGIFFDHLQEGDLSKDKIKDFVCAVGNTFLKAYLPIVAANKHKDYTEAEKQWQQLRRGRYVEFNLVYDRGTQFGLKTNGRIESILMSLPYTAGWEYDHQPEPNSKEAQTLAQLKKDVDWVGATAPIS